MKFDDLDHFDKDHLLSEMDHIAPPHKLMTLSTLHTLLPPLTAYNAYTAYRLNLFTQ